MPTFQRKFLFPLFLSILAFVAIFVMEMATPAGAGLANDSVAYIAGARSILQGTGYSDIWLDSVLEPITHYPPLLSITLSAIGLTGVDPLRSVRVLNIFLFGMNTLLICLLGYKLTRSKILSVWIGAIFLLNSSLLRVSLYAMSEPLFLFLNFAAFLVYFLALEHPDRPVWLALVGLFSGLAILTRYSGLALIPTFSLMILVSRVEFKQKTRNLVLFLLPVILLVGAWFARNKLVASSVTNRTLEFHPITVENITPAIFNLARIFLPIDAIRDPLYISGLWTVLLVFGAIGLFGYSLWLIHQAFTTKLDLTNNAITALLVYFFSYLGSIFFSISFFDHSTKFQDRILAPAIVVFFLVSAHLLQLMIQAFGNGKYAIVTKLLYGLVILGSIVVSLAGELNAMKAFSSEGQGYASWKYHDSTIMAALKTLPKGVTIYTNTPPAVYLVTGRSVKVLPTKVDPVSNTVRSGFDQDLAEMIGQIRNGKAYLAIFNTNDLESSEQFGLLDEIRSQLTRLKKTGDAELFGVSLP